jgi:hypothetical protein
MPSPLTRLQAPRQPEPRLPAGVHSRGSRWMGTRVLATGVRRRSRIQAGRAATRSVIWVVRYVAVERISERDWSCFRPASVRRPRWGVRAAPAAAWRGPSRDNVRVKLERLSLTPQSQRPPKPKGPKDKSARSNRHVRFGAGEDSRTPSHGLNSGGLVGSQPMELCHGCRPVLQLTTTREFRFSSTYLVASADDNDARVEQS